MRKHLGILFPKSKANLADPKATHTPVKQPFNIDMALQRIGNAIKAFPKAALFELHEQGFTSAFELLIACIISIRTRDEVTVPAAQRLFKLARTANAISQLSIEQIDGAIKPSMFHEAKARQIQVITQCLVSEHGGLLPCNEEFIRSLHGVGPKCTNLVLGIACNEPRIGVDIHVHRVTNRWGYVSTISPDKTIAELETKLPRQYWVEINRLLVPFGKNICSGLLPHCSICPVLDMCQQVDVKAHR